MSGTIEGNSSRSSGSIAAKGSGITTSSGDPALDTNPESVGTMFVNTTSGETYVCSDITAGANVWKNIGDGAGNIAPFHFTNASLYCFNPGGATTGDQNQLHIDKFVFASDGDAADQGDLSQNRRGMSHSSSTTHGYSAGGYAMSPSPVGQSNYIDKFAMASAADATDVGDVSVAGETHAGVTSETYGHAVGGGQGLRRCDRYSFASDGDAVNLGNFLSVNRDYPMGGSSQTHGYIMGSYSGTPTNQIEKFAFADDALTANVGDITQAKVKAASHCQAGYVWTSGSFQPPATNQIDKMTTASDSDSVDAASDLSEDTLGTACGSMSSTYGYCMGGIIAGPHADVCDKWPFASTSTATVVGNLTNVHEAVFFSGCQL